MIYLVTTQDVNFSSNDVTVTDNFEGIANVVDTVDDVVYHSAVEDSIDRIGYLSDFSKRNIALYCIGYSDILAVQIIRASGGIVYEDESTINDLDLLKYITDISSRDELLVSYNVSREVQIVDNYATNLLTALKENDSVKLKQLRNSSYLKSFCEASLIVIEATQKAVDDHDLQMREMIRIISEMLERANSWDMKRRKTDLDFSRMEQELSELKLRMSLDSGSKITNYPTYNLSVSSTCKLLYVKEYTPCQWLTTFLICYVKYLQNKKGIANARLLIIHENTNIWKLKYAASSVFKEINPTVAMHGKLEHTLYTTCEPTKDVLDLLTSKSPVLIVIERFHRLGTLITGRGVVSKNAFGSIRDINLFMAKEKFPLDSVIQSVGTSAKLANTILIPKIPAYPGTTNAMSRETLYLQACENEYKLFSRLDRDLDIK